MPQIVHQSAYLSYSPFLALPAPQIAGLLTATVPSSDPPPAPESVPRAFTYTNARLDHLTDGEFEHLIRAATTLLDVGVNFILGCMNEDALRAAEVVFHRGCGGGKPNYPMNPATYAAEGNADLVALAVGLPRRFSADAREQARQRMEARLAAYQAAHHDED